MEKRRKTRHASDYLEYGGEEGLPADSMAEAESRYIKDLIRAEIHVEKANEKQEELLQDTAKRYGLEGSKELDALLRDEYKEKTSKEFLVDGAILTCTNSTKELAGVPTGGPCGERRSIRAAEGIDMSGSGIEDLDTSKVYARLTVSENGFSSDGLMHATVADCEPWVNIPCFGNCDRPADSEAEIKALQARYLNGSISMPKALKDGTKGTCVCLRKLEERWENAYIPFGSYATFQNGETGEELAGITMTSILFCRHGGFIYPVTSGQEIACVKEEETEEKDLEERIQELVDSVEGKPMGTFEEIKNLSTMEILSRVIYQEAYLDGQNAVMFSLLNRLFSETPFQNGTKSNSIYSIVTGENQYEAVTRDDQRYPNGYQPPIDTDSEDERKKWENGKRLAAILYIAIEDYGETNERTDQRDSGEKVIQKGDWETYEKVVAFLKEQVDVNGEMLNNPIGKRDSFHRGKAGTKDIDPIDIKGNTFYYLQ